jgi:thioredoxin reductase
MSATIDVAIIGAGPAGLAAAIAAGRCGVTAIVYDENASPGGQIYRAIATASPAVRQLLGDDYARGAPLVDAFRASGAGYAPATTVWAVAPRAEGGFDLALAGEASAVHARAVIVATGALERPLPIPGWTLPGVMLAGAAQAVLKSAGLVAQGPTVMVGSGPLLWLVAWQYLRAGAPIAALLDTTPRGRLAQVLRHAPSFLSSPYFAKGRALMRDVRRRVRVIEYVDDVAVEGARAVEAVRFRVRGREETVAAHHVLLHQGVVPDVRLASALGCALRYHDVMACFEPATDVWGGSSLPGLHFAGDAAGVAGADVAHARGELAALAVANAQGRIDGNARDRAAQAPLRALAAALRGRRFLDALYRPADRFRVPSGDTLACRCEEVPAREICALARDARLGPNDVKACTRAGMGPCQGRYCALTVAEIIARERGCRAADVGLFRARFPLAPVALSDIASLPASERERAAVERPAH